MSSLPKKLQARLKDREDQNSLRHLGTSSSLVDFSSNDYLGFADSKTLFSKTHAFLKEHQIIKNGATGSRLLSGNHKLYDHLETLICEFHHSESAVVFNSGYDANLGFFSSVPQRHDIIIYDELSHASIRDGIQLSLAKKYKFKHNDIDHLESLLKSHSKEHNDYYLYVVTESVFSMDGDSPDLIKLTLLCERYNALLVVDEAHAIGVHGDFGKGYVHELQLEEKIFARLITFGKALGCHGAAILCNHELKSYLINFARSFIYTTALPPHSIASVISAYDELSKTNGIGSSHRTLLDERIDHFNNEVERLKMSSQFIPSRSAIHSCIISGNDFVKDVSKKLKHAGFNVKPILSPTVPKNEERLRFCIHSYNSESEITEVLELLATFAA